MKRYRITVKACAIWMLLMGFLCAAMATGLGTVFSILCITLGLYFLHETKRKEYHQ